MFEWHLPPEYIVNNWTYEKLNLMVKKLAERKAQQFSKNNNVISDDELFRKMGNKVKVVKN